MDEQRRDLAACAALYAALTGVLMALPLVQTLHAESSAIVAGGAFWIAGMASVGAFRRGNALGDVAVRQLALLLIPLAGLTLSLGWAPNRGYSQGLLLFVTFAIPSVVLAVSLAFALVVRWERGRGAFAFVGAAILVMTPLWDLGLHPQFYHYNHVFGGVLGPIYDETLALRPGLFAFRGLTLLWAAALVAWAMGRRSRLVAIGATIALTYALGPWLGLTTPAWRTQQVLGSHARSAHIDLYYADSHLTPTDARRHLREAEFAYARLADLWQSQPGERIQIYLYPDAQVKADVTGAAYTNVAPVWLADPQIHVLGQAWARVLDHELAHAFSREFGLPVARASLLVGLVEGLAGAAEPPEDLPSPTEQVAATHNPESRIAERLARSMGAGGFWGGRGAVSYATTASFVGFVADRHGWPSVVEAYAWGDLDRTTGVSIDRLARQWEAHVVATSPIPVQAAPLAARRFGAPSLFEKPSPHWTPPAVRLTRGADRALLGLAPDTLAAIDLLDRALAADSSYLPALARRADLRLYQGRSDLVLTELNARYQTPDDAGSRVPTGILTLWADAEAMSGNRDAALALYGQALERHRMLDAPQGVLWLRLARLAAADGSTAARYGRPALHGVGGVLWAMEHLDDARARDLLTNAQVDLDSPGASGLWSGYRALYLSQAAWSGERYADSRDHARAAAAWFGRVGHLPGARTARHHAQRAAWALTSQSQRP